MEKNQLKQEEAGAILFTSRKKMIAKRMTAVLVVVVFLFGAAFFQVDAKTRQEKIVKYFYEGSQLIEVISRKIKDKDISANAKISAKKLNLKNSIGTKQLKNGAVTAAKLANGLVISATIEDGSITAGKIADGSIVSIKLADGSITTAKIENGAITNEKIANNEISGAKLANDININTSGDISAQDISAIGSITAAIGGFFGNLTGDVTGNLFGNADTATFATTSANADTVTDG
ncbi:MAG: hypothetical protein US70_C0015G0024 [Parcubacteria group bacterium GW2011_GWD2_38_11]|nr:MAG: hypothetical protein US70_C0015G0024 [Parcubacteria group bacterium GW2011_GWD2_38_11]